MVRQFIRGELDVVKYEDELRSLLGAGAYQLFTVDRMVQQVIKQMVSLMGNSLTKDVLAMYQREQQRNRSGSKDWTVEQSARFARQYLSNCEALLNDESVCILMEYVSDWRRVLLLMMVVMEWNRFD